jgi:hypothetical protein
MGQNQANGKSAPQAVTLLTHVEIEMSYPRDESRGNEGEAEKLAFDIVPDAQADYYAGYLGESTPLAKAIMGCRVGNVVVYKAGEEACKVRILSIQPAAGKPGGEADARRAAVQQAREQIAKTDAMIFASTVEGKWGEYDTDSMEAASMNDAEANDDEHPVSEDRPGMNAPG